MARRRCGDGGFTLIELLLVIIVLGILAAIVVMAVGSLRHDSSEAVCRTQVKAVERAAEQYRVQYNQNPSQTDIAGAPAAPLKSWPDATDYHLAWNGTDAEVHGAQGAMLGSGPDACALVGTSAATAPTTVVVGSGNNGNNGNGAGNGNGNGGVGNGNGNGNPPANPGNPHP